MFDTLEERWEALNKKHNYPGALYGAINKAFKCKYADQDFKEHILEVVSYMGTECTPQDRVLAVSKDINDIIDKANKFKIINGGYKWQKK